MSNAERGNSFLGDSTGASAVSSSPHMLGFVFLPAGARVACGVLLAELFEDWLSAVGSLKEA
ncbi:MAG: hypothetical protein ACK5O8_03210 [Pirellula sp.]